MNLRDLYSAGFCARRAPGPATARQTSSADCPREAAQQGACSAATVHTLAFRAATGKAFTTFFAGFIRVLILHKPGSVKIPCFATSLVAISAMLPMSFAHTDFFSSLSVASASARAPLVMALAVFIALGAILCVGEGASMRRGDAPVCGT